MIRHLVENSIQDLKYSAASIVRNPAFSIALLATLVIGIGTTTAIFSVIDGIIFRPLPYGNASALVSMGLVQSLEKNEFVASNFYNDWRKYQSPFVELTSESIGPTPCDVTDAEPMHLRCVQVEANFLQTLQVEPTLGRAFTWSDSQYKNGQVALISYQLWNSRYNRSPSVLNRFIKIEDSLVHIVGVLPPEFELPTLDPFDIIRPFEADQADSQPANRVQMRRAFGRLKRGINIEQARLAMQPLFRYALAQIPPGINKSDFRLSIRTLRDRQMHSFMLTAWALLGAVISVLVIACANAASLMLARGASRMREIAVRSALGAGGIRLLFQALNESLVLSACAAAFGLLLASFLLHFFVAIAPQGLIVLSKAQLNARMVIVAVLLSIVCSATAALIPLLQQHHASELVSRSGQRRTRNRLLRFIVAAQLVVSVVLLSISFLLLRSLWHLQGQGLGFDTHQILIANVVLPKSSYSTDYKRHAYFRELGELLNRMPGVKGVALSTSIPPDAGADTRHLEEVAVDGQPVSSVGSGATVVDRQVSAGYFEVLRVPIVQGSTFTQRDQASRNRLVVVSRSLAERLFPHRNPVGQYIELDHVQNPNQQPYRVVGVAANARNGGLANGDSPEFYRLKTDTDGQWPNTLFISVRFSGSKEMTEDSMKGAFRQVDASLPIQVESMSEHVHSLADRPRFEAALLSGFGLAGLSLAAVGLYGVSAYRTSLRTQEIGIRMAVGADRFNILLLMLKEGFTIVLAAGSCGLVVAFMLARILNSKYLELYQLSPGDPLSFLAVALTLASTSLLAVYIPANRASKIHPTAALRQD